MKKPILNLRVKKDLLIYHSAKRFMLPSSYLQEIYKKKGGNGVESFCRGLVVGKENEYTLICYLRDIYPLRRTLSLKYEKELILHG